MASFSRKRCMVKLILFIFLLSISCPVLAEAGTKDIDKQEEKLISQIESYYNQAKRSLAKGKFLSAIVKLNHVIELEKEFYIVYTPYAKQYIQQAQEKIREKEKVNLKSDVKKEPEKKEKKQKKQIVAANSSEGFEYTIGAGDVLYISVWQEQDLSQEVIVRPDGKISFPLAGDVPAAGLTFGQLKEELTQRLKDYIKYPVVSISLRKLGGKKVIVLGEVAKPGVYSVTGKSTILEAVALAGGFTPDAVVSSTILIRGGFQSPKGKRLNLKRAIGRAEMSQNVTLQPEDIVYVPKKFIANVNYALTQILGPLSQGASTASSIRYLQD